MEQPRIFRQEALDRLARPEQFDRALIVTTPKAWLALAALAAIAAAVAVWSVQGAVTTYVSANGILLSRGGAVVDAVSASTGSLVAVLPAENDIVERGAVVAEVVNHELAERHRSAVALVDERAQAVEDLKAATAAEDALAAGNAKRQFGRLAQREASARQQVEAARRRLDDYRRLFDERVVTRAVVDRSQRAVDRAEQELFGVLRERDALDARELRRGNDQRLRVAEMEARLAAARRQATELEALLGDERVTAPASGRVTEIKAPVGAVLRAGQPVLSIRSGAGSLEALVYIPPADGKRVRPGMDVLVSPGTLRREEYGSVLGTVETVSEFPASLEGMVSVLENRALARTFSEAGPPYAARVSLTPDPATASGVAWTSPKAAGETLSPGTLAGVEIKVDSRPPITLVVPLLRDLGF